MIWHNQETMQTVPNLFCSSSVVSMVVLVCCRHIIDTALWYIFKVPSYFTTHGLFVSVEVNKCCTISINMLNASVMTWKHVINYTSIMFICSLNWVVFVDKAPIRFLYIAVLAKGIVIYLIMCHKKYLIILSSYLLICPRQMIFLITTVFR